MSMNIITVSREFGSGGRELGRRIAEALGYDYYDGEIIAAIAKKCGLDEGYVENALEDHSWQAVPLTVHNTFASPMVLQAPQVGLLLEQKRVIEEIGKRGRSCVIVGPQRRHPAGRIQPLQHFCLCRYGRQSAPLH